MRPENLVSAISQKRMKGISHNFGHRFISVYRCADQRSRSQQAMTLESNKHHISKTSDFTQFWSQVYLASYMC